MAMFMPPLGTISSGTVSTILAAAASRASSTWNLSVSPLSLTMVFTTTSPFPMAYWVAMDSWMSSLDFRTALTMSSPLAMLAVMNDDSTHPLPWPDFLRRGYSILVNSDDRYR